MPIQITQDCINCGACADVCPNGGIRKGTSAYSIKQDMCTECVGFFKQEQCVAVCPIDCCVRNPRMVLSEQELFDRAAAIHASSGKNLTLTAETSHFRTGAKHQGAPESLWERLFGKKQPIATPAVSSNDNA